MTSWQQTQTEFGNAVRTPGADTPSSVAPTRAGNRADRRFDVYRNNHMSSLIDALAARFDVTRQLVGDDFFRSLAREHIREAPPASPILMHYGAGLADHIARFAPADDLPFLADLARLEWAIGESYHAADADPLGVEALGNIPMEQAGAARVAVHPSLRLIRSQWPVFSIWAAHQTDDPAAALAPIAQAPEAGMTIRPGLDVDVRALAPPAFALIAAFGDGATLDDAFAQTDGVAPEDFGGLLGFVFAAGVVTELKLTSATNHADA
ncbi:MAG: DNA-binding domain-containing protein [Pseudomonadota bacterium]